MSIQTEDLAGRCALVTGATSGIGREVAIRLVRDGAEVKESGGQASFVGADLSDPVELRRLVDEVGDVDVLVNNAGFSWFGPTVDLDVDTFDALFASNVRAPYFL